jgi:hypothetical protein
MTEQEFSKETRALQKKEVSGSTRELTPEIESGISAVHGGQLLPEPV